MSKNGKTKTGASKISKLDLYERVSEFIRIGNEAVHKAQEKNRKLGISNVYGINNQVVFEMPDGTISAKSPWEKLYREKKIKFQ